MTKTARHHYDYLDFLRGIAVLWVFLYHINIFFKQPDPLSPQALTLFLSSGFLGVDIFFVLSGFLITNILIDNLDHNSGIQRFYTRRFFKIIPQYFLMLFSVIILIHIIPFNLFLQHIGQHPKNQSFLNSFLFIQNYSKEINLLVAHTWSLAIEEHFYLVYPLFLSMIWYFFSQKRDRNIAAVIFLLIMIFIGNLLRFLYEHQNVEALSFNSAAPYQTTLLRFDALMIGCLIKFLEPSLHKLKEKHIISRLLMTSALATYIFIITQQNHKESWYYFTLASLAPSLILTAAILGFNRYAAVPIIQFIGKNSYGLYLWHYPLIFIFLVLPIATWLKLALYVPTALLAGIFSTTTIEAYFLRIRNKLFP